MGVVLATVLSILGGVVAASTAGRGAALFITGVWSRRRSACCFS